MVKIPGIIKRVFPEVIWEIKTNNKVQEKSVYLTFDDGPAPEVTNFVIETLNSFDAKATFFVVGNNVYKYPEIYKKIQENGHAIGNHTFNHLNGWKTSDTIYFQDVEKCNELISSNLFRPPYGKMRLSQFKFLKKHYKIIFWSIISYDFDENLSWHDCLTNVIKNIKPGSIVVFHDSIKASKRLIPLLPILLKTLKELKYKFEKLEF